MKLQLDNKLWILITVIVTVGLVAGGWFLGVQPQLTLVAESALAQVTVDAKNDLTRAQVASLAAAKEDLPELEAEADDLQKGIPAGVNGSAFIAQLNAMASATGVTIKLFNLTPPIPYALTSDAAPAPAATDGAATTEGDTATETPVVPADPTGPTPVTDPLITSDNFVVVPISIEVMGPNENVLAFLKAVQYGDRLVSATAVQKTRGEDLVTYKLVVGGSMFVLRSHAAELAAAAADATTTEG